MLSEMYLLILQEYGQLHQEMMDQIFQQNQLYQQFKMPIYKVDSFPFYLYQMQEIHHPYFEYQLKI